MKKMNSLEWMLLGVLVGSTSHMCYCEVQKCGGIKPAINKMLKKDFACCDCCSCNYK